LKAGITKLLLDPKWLCYNLATCASSSYPAQALAALWGLFMQHRQPRLGDIVDDYCPRERRLTNHAVVAMVGADIKQTRCTTCDAEHEYKQAKVPTIRRKKEGAPALTKQAPVAPQPDAVKAAESATPPVERAARPVDPPVEAEPEPAEAGAQEEPEAGAELDDEDGPVHRRLIRAQLPRPEGQVTQRPLPQFTVRQPTKFGSNNARGGSGGGGGRGPGGGSVGRGRPTNVRGGFGRSVSRPESFPGRSGGAHHPQPRAHQQGGRPMRHGKKSPK
jgi:hypothetical protein